MAFNPFTWFRRHQKVLFAVLTIFTMISFIGCFGAGDVMHKVLGWMGGQGRPGDLVTTIHGNKVYERDIQDLREQRRAANEFLFQVLGQSIPKAVQDLLDGPLKGLSADSPLFGAQIIAESARDRRLSTESLADIHRDMERLRKLADGPKVKGDNDLLKILDTLAVVLSYQRWELARTSPYLFGGGDGLDELLDFALLRSHADRLGITLTEADVIGEINRQAGNRNALESKTFAQDKAVSSFLAVHGGSREQRRMSAKNLLDALRDEFRVAMARGILLGSEPGVRASRLVLGGNEVPALGTPDEFFRYFRENRTTLTAEFLSVPVERFLDQVKETPTEKELRNRYDRYKDREPNPTSPEPGFKEPRRVSLEYVSVSPDDPFYKEQGRKMAQGLEMLSDPLVAARYQMAAPAGIAPAGAGPLGWAAAVAAPMACNPIQLEYEPLEPLEPRPGHERRSVSRDFVFGNYANELEYRRAASVFGVGQGGVPVLSVLAALAAPAPFPEAKDALVYASEMLLGGAVADPFAPVGAAGIRAAALTLPFQPKPIPLERVREQIVDSLADTFSRTFFEENVRTFEVELAKLKARPAEAEAYVAKAAKEYHFKLVKTAPLPRYNFEEMLARKSNPDLERLADAVAARFGNRKALVDSFLFGRGIQEGERAATTFPEGVYQLPEVVFQFSMPDETGRPRPREFRQPLLLRDKGETFLFWRAADLSPRVRPFREVRDEVVRAWKMERARKLASIRAKEIATAVRDKKMNPGDAERFLREQKLGPVFELSRVSLLLPPEREVHEKVGKEYTPYRVPERLHEDLPYPPDDLVKQLLQMKEVGDAEVIVDKPAKHYYVAVLAARSVPDDKEFKALYASTPLSDSLYRHFEAERARMYEEEVLKQLRREAGPTDKDGARFQVAEEIRKRFSGRTTEEE